MPLAASSVSQPKGDLKCSIYAPMAAYNIWTGKLPNVGLILSKIPYRLGGNSDEAFTALLGYGITFGASYKGAWGRMLSLGAQNKHPIAFGVSWKKGTSSGNHWVYSAGDMSARDQQNLHQLITIDPKTWVGTAIGGWTYTINMLGLGCPDRNAARPYVG